MKPLPKPTFDSSLTAWRYPLKGKRDLLVWRHMDGGWMATGADSDGKYCIAPEHEDAMRGLYAMMGVEL